MSEISTFGVFSEKSDCPLQRAKSDFNTFHFFFVCVCVGADLRFSLHRVLHLTRADVNEKSAIISRNGEFLENKITSLYSRKCKGDDLDHIAFYKNPTFEPLYFPYRLSIPNRARNCSYPTQNVKSRITLRNRQMSDFLANESFHFVSAELHA